MNSHNQQPSDQRINFAKLILLACPVVLASMLMETFPAHASETASLLQLTRINPEQTAVNHPVSVASNQKPDRLPVPTGCTCARCMKVEELLQARLPGF